MDTEELEKRITEEEVELGKLAFDDPRRKDFVERISVMRKSLSDSIKVETDRINSYRQNDNNEERIRIEEAKIKSDKIRSILDITKEVVKGIFTVGGALLGLNLVYRYEDLQGKFPYKPMQNVLNMFRIKW